MYLRVLPCSPHNATCRRGHMRYRTHLYTSRMVLYTINTYIHNKNGGKRARRSRDSELVVGPSELESARTGEGLSAGGGGAVRPRGAHYSTPTA